MHKGWLRLFVIIAYFALSAGNSALGAPLCASLFKTLSKEGGHVTALLDEVATLRMTLDLAQAQGLIENSPHLKAMQSVYVLKLAELHQSSGLSEQEIKSSIIEKIRPLQKQENQNQKSASTQRAEHIKTLQIFVHKKSVKLQPVGNLKDLNYIPELGKLSIYAHDGPRLYAIQDGKMEFTHIGNTKGFKILPDLKHGLAIQPLTQAVHLYEMGRREPLESYPTEMAFTDGAGIDFSPSNQQALLTELFGRAHILNFASKKFTTLTMPGKLSYSYAHRRGYFINESVVLIASESLVTRIDLTSGQFIEKEIFENQQQQAVISEDRKTLLVYSAKKMIALNAETLEPLSVAVDFNSQGKSIEEVSQIPGTNQLWVRLKDTDSLEQSFATEIEIPQFEFQSPFPIEKDTVKITLTSDSSEAFVLHKGFDNQYQIEHWQR